MKRVLRMPNPMHTPTCPHCQRRRVIEIHRTAGGAVARIGKRPCECPESRRRITTRHANRHLAMLAMIPAGITGFFCWAAGLEAGIFSAATIGIAAVIVYGLNGKLRD